MKSQKSDKWINAHYDSFASINTFGQCITFSDLNGDGDFKLILADYNDGKQNVKLRVYKGTNLSQEVNIIDNPVSIISIYLDILEPRVPAVCVASSSCIYVFKNMRPFYKFTFPSLPILPAEMEAWKNFKMEQISVVELVTQLTNIKKTTNAYLMTSQSLKLLRFQMPNERDAFANQCKHSTISRQNIITCMTSLKKTLPTEDGVSCIIMGTEEGSINILDSQTFTILATIELESVATFLDATGTFEMQFTIIAVCRNGSIYSCSRDMTKFQHVCSLSTHAVGMKRCGENIVVACMDSTLLCYGLDSKLKWKLQLNSDILSMELFVNKSRNIQGVLVSLENKEVRLYVNNVLVDVLLMEKTITDMKYGNFGRESDALVMIEKGGGLIVKMLKRKAVLDKDTKVLVEQNKNEFKLEIPKKNRLYLEQCKHEKENAFDIYQECQKDIFMLRLETMRAYCNMLQKSLSSVSYDLTAPIKLNVEVTGLGPIFKLMLGIQNTSTTQMCTDLFVNIDYDEKVYSLKSNFMQLPMIVPNVTYTCGTFITCLAMVFVSDVIKVYVCTKKSPIPVVTAFINMPASEGQMINGS